MVTWLLHPLVAFQICCIPQLSHCGEVVFNFCLPIFSGLKQVHRILFALAWPSIICFFGCLTQQEMTWGAFEHQGFPAMQSLCMAESGGPKWIREAEHSARIWKTAWRIRVLQTALLAAQGAVVLGPWISFYFKICACFPSVDKKSTCYEQNSNADVKIHLALPQKLPSFPTWRLPTVEIVVFLTASEKILIKLWPGLKLRGEGRVMRCLAVWLIGGLARSSHNARAGVTSWEPGKKTVTVRSTLKLPCYPSFSTSMTSAIRKKDKRNRISLDKMVSL